MGIIITQTHARIGLHQNHAKVEIETSMKLLQAPGLKTIWIWQGK